jgi:hypothetical protein
MKMGKKVDMKNTDILNWLHNSKAVKEKWVKTQKEILAQSKIKECTFKPNINKKSGDKGKFSNLYQKAKRKQFKKSKELTKNEIEYEKQKNECTFEPKINKRKSSEKMSIEVRKDSNQNSNPEVTSTLRNIDQIDFDYVNKKIEEFRHLNDDMSAASAVNSENSHNHTPVKIGNVLAVDNKFLSETPKTEELEEEMRDQVLEYQNPIFDIGMRKREGEIHMHKNLSPEDNGIEYIENDPENDDNPLLFVDVNLGPDKAERIVVFEGDTAVDLASRFAERHNLNEIMTHKLTQLLEAEISSLNN